MTALNRLPAAEQRRLVDTGEASAVDLVEAALVEVEAKNGDLNAIVTLADDALDVARDLDARRARGEDTGPLHGLPVGIKDVTEVAGLRTTWGSPLYADHVPAVDALVVERLRAAGAVILGKTNTPEFATGGNTFNEVFGADPESMGSRALGRRFHGRRCRRHWPPGLIGAGGGHGPRRFAVVFPASFCGVVGLRPSPGFVPTVPSSFLWDSYQVTGGMARTAADLALMLQATAGPSSKSPMHQPWTGRDLPAAVDASPEWIRGKRFAYVPDLVGIGVDEGVEQACRAAAFALRDAGAVVEEIALDLSWAWQPFLALRGFWMLAQQHHRLEYLDGMGENLAGNIRRGQATSAEALGHAEQARTRLWIEMGRFFERYDHLLTPTLAVLPFR